MKNTSKILTLFLSLVVSFGFVGEVLAVGEPSVVTGSTSNVTNVSARSSGSITSLGSSDPTSKGFEYGLDTNYGLTSSTSFSSVMSYTYLNFFNSPGGIGVDSSGSRYVPSTFLNFVRKTTNDGNDSLQFGSTGSANNQFNSSSAVAIDLTGNIYVADLNNSRIKKFDSDGNYVSQFGNHRYSSLTIDHSGNFYAFNIDNGYLEKFNSSGVYQSQIFINDSNYYGIAVDESDNVYVSLITNSKVQKFDSSGNFISEFGSSGSGNGQFNNPRGLSVDIFGNIYVADSGNNRIQKFDSAFNYISQVSVSSPVSLSSVDPFGYIYVAASNQVGRISVGSPYLLNLSNLSCGSIYHYRAFATNSAGTGYGNDATFTTTACSTEKAITSLSIGNIEGTIDEGNHTISMIVNINTNLASLTPSISVSSYASISPLTNVAQDFTNPVTYTVTAEDGSTQSYVVTVTKHSIQNISSCAEFEAINTDTTTLDGSYSLTTDLDCTSEGNDIMVATNGDPFTGTFDGNNHTITVSINSGSYSALFSRANGATITDLNIAGSIVSSSGDIGSLIGYVYNRSDGDTHPILTITNVHSTATVTSDGGYVGGLIGEIYNYGSGDVGDTTAVNIADSSYTGNVTGTYYVGGLVGYIDQEEGASTSITNSYAVGDINGTDNEVGGLVGEWDQYDGDVVMTGNHYSGNITSTSSYVGGLVGYMYSDVGGGYEERTVTISDNYTTGSVSGSEDVGGMFGYSEFYIDQSFPLTVNIENNYSTADITSDYGVAGGLVGELYTYNYNTDYPLNINLNQNYATGTITSNIENEYGDVGGLFGRIDISNDYTTIVLSKSYFSGDIVTAGNYVGGLIGDLQNDGDTSMAINDSYASADITAYDGLGGLVGYVYASNGADLNVNRSYVIGTVTGSDVNNSGEGGGLIGVINGGLNITDSFSAALVQAFDYGYGAVVGYANNPFTTINVYFDQTTAGGIECADNDTIEGCTPVNTNETPNTTYFKSNHTNTPLDEWDFTDIWINVTDENNNYPILRTFYTAPTPEPAPEPTLTPSSNGSIPLYIVQQMSDNLRNQTTTNTQTNTNTGTKFIFTKNLKYKMRDSQVIELQKFLNNNGYPISLTGIGSLGNETNYFGKATQSALAKFQKANRIKPAIGYFGPVTRARVNR